MVIKILGMLRMLCHYLKTTCKSRRSRKLYKGENNWSVDPGAGTGGNEVLASRVEEGREDVELLDIFIDCSWRIDDMPSYGCKCEQMCCLEQNDGKCEAEDATQHHTFMEHQTEQSDK